jgi:small redox-active disulfide protein 2
VPFPEAQRAKRRIEISVSEPEGLASEPLERYNGQRRPNEMLSIKVLGPGCANCERVHAVAKAALKSAGVEDATILHVTDRAEYPQYGLLYTPGLVINEKLVCGGRIPNQAEVVTWIMNALAAQ